MREGGGGSTIGGLRNALGMCKREARRSESAIGVTKTGRPQAAVGIVRAGVQGELNS